MQDILEVAERAWKESAAEPPLLTRGQKSKYGLPKNTVQSFLDIPVSKDTARWLKARNKYDCLILDALDAREAGLIDAAALAREKVKIVPLYQHADKNFQACFARDRARAEQKKLPSHRHTSPPALRAPRPRKKR